MDFGYFLGGVSAWAIGVAVVLHLKMDSWQELFLLFGCFGLGAVIGSLKI